MLVVTCNQWLRIDEGSQPVAARDDQLWAAITEPTRRRLLDLLLADGPRTATQLAAPLGITRQAVAKHLVVLERAGMAAGRRDGRELHWRIRPEGVDAATRSIAAAAAAWDERLAALRRLAVDDPASHERFEGER